MNRRDFLAGNLSGLVVGVGATWGVSMIGEPLRPTITVGPPRPETVPEISYALPWVKTSYAQQGEDLIIKNIFDTFGIARPSYIDVGAFDPVIGSNTYLLYSEGCRGVLVEPNPTYVRKLRSVRPGDTVVAAGIGTTEAKEADYYVIRGDGQLNTFSREQAEARKRQFGADSVVEVLKLPLLKLNDVMEQHFEEAPALFSVDAEGLDLAIVQTLDFDRWRPKVFCIETAMVDALRPDPRIFRFMASKGYVQGGGNYVNTVFVDQRLYG
jgi:FkbM family methyltransferase